MGGLCSRTPPDEDGGGTGGGGGGGTGGDPTGFVVVFEFGEGLNENQKAIFDAAAKRWMEIVQKTTNGRNLRLVITASGPRIDGPGRVLGQAGPTRLRLSDRLPVAGIMEFDRADLADLERDGSLKDVILHEMGHVLGIGTLWETKNLLTGTATNNPQYVGENAMREYATLLGPSEPPTPVPVANTGGPGTALGHWRETTFDFELMTGFAEQAPAVMPLSRLTVATLQDLGYQVSYDAADPYSLPRPSIMSSAASKGHSCCKAMKRPDFSIE
mmetsp:Transcript_11985/g.21775  ORF Transcript_11985/g.21775 Transcript_11985/m.21775 type:complete len:272 (-) Transcript_11985:1925-2740(-)